MQRRDKLRNFGKFLGVYLLTALGALMLLVSCDKWQHRPDNYDVANDSVKIAEAIQNFNNPQFSSVVEIAEYREIHASALDIDSVFFSLSPKTIEDVATVLFKSNKTSITKEDIVKEYRRCKSVYDKLPASTDTYAKAINEVDRTATDLGNRQETTKITFRTDTINGKPQKVIIRTIETYVKE